MGFGAVLASHLVNRPLVSVLQFAENLTDRQAAHAVRSRIDVKYLLGLELSDSGFDFTALSGFRQRLLEHGLENSILDLALDIQRNWVT